MKKKIFLTVFAVFSSEHFADTLVIAFFVHWQTLAVVLTGPASAGCLKRICTLMHVSKSMGVAASYKLATELLV